MDGYGADPPDGRKSNDIGLQSESILPAMEIKQEPTVKKEPEEDNDILLVSQSSHTADSASFGNAIGTKQGNSTDACSDFYDMDALKLEEKAEKVKEENKQVAGNSAKKKRMSRKTPTKRFSKCGSRNVGNKNRSNDVRGGTKPSEAKTKGKKRKCSMCDYVTAKRSHLNKHMLTHTGEKPFPCTVCPKRFTRKQSLQSHMKTHVDDFLFSCSTCLQGFNRSDEKMVHEADCNVLRYECHLCKKFSTFYKNDLEIHFRVHTGEKPFECDQCSMKFTRANQMKLHRKTHANPRPLKFKCSVCFKNFAHQMEKENHEANCKRRGYECDVCKTYTTYKKGNLIRHMRTHTGEKPFQCAKCSKRFSTKAHLNRHQKIHK